MVLRPTNALAAATAAAVLIAAPLSARDQQDQQDQQRHHHQHYEKPAEPPPPGPTGELAPRLQNLGDHTMPVSTTVEQAQRFFDQGLRLGYGFNHAEAGRAFEEARRLDSSLAMAVWGQALVLGPNINMPMEPSLEPTALALVEEAAALAALSGSPRERAYIEALRKRYTGSADDRTSADHAYAAAMREVHRAAPEDLEAATLFAESLMDLMPWAYWTRDGEPTAHTAEVIATLELVLGRNPNHPGALHLWIHLWEATDTPERALDAADRLLELVPGAGHLVHMPSHIYYRLGRHADAVRSNELAIAADEDYITQCSAQGLYALGYYPHNIHMLWAAAMMSGNGKQAIESADKAAAKVPLETLAEVPILQAFLTVPYGARVRFGRWEELLAIARPAPELRFVTGFWHWSRGMALVRLGRLDEATTELAALRTLVADPELDAIPATFSYNSASGVLRIAPEVLAGELAAARGKFDEAIAHLHSAVLFEDHLGYTEPPDWPQPARHSLGAVLLSAGRPIEAEQVFWEDLRRNPGNGWALFGLAQALRAQGREAEAVTVDERQRAAWTRADVVLTAARY
jgi:tetratricopeptide (TPR) repeat protein